MVLLAALYRLSAWVRSIEAYVALAMEGEVGGEDEGVTLYEIDGV